MSGVALQMLLAGCVEPVVATFVAANTIGDTSGTYTVPSRRSLVILCWSAQTSPATAPTSCTISGHAATSIISNGAATNGSTIFAAMVDPSDANTWSVSHSNIFSSRCRAEIYTATAGRINATATAASTASAPTATLDVAAGSAYIGVANSQHAGSATTSWTLLTEDDDADTNLHTYSSAHSNYTSAAAAQAATATFTATAGSGGVFAVFSP